MYASPWIPNSSPFRSTKNRFQIIVIFQFCPWLLCKILISNTLGKIKRLKISKQLLLGAARVSKKIVCQLNECKRSSILIFFFFCYHWGSMLTKMKKIRQKFGTEHFRKPTCNGDYYQEPIKQFRCKTKLKRKSVRISIFVAVSIT